MALCALALTGAAAGDATAVPHEAPIPVKAFRIVERESGPNDYYTITPPPDAFIHADYRPPFKTAVLGYQIPEGSRRSVAGLRWSWRAIVLPRGGDECKPGRGDSAAAVYVSWKRGLRLDPQVRP